MKFLTYNRNFLVQCDSKFLYYKKEELFIKCIGSQQEQDYVIKILFEVLNG